MDCLTYVQWARRGQRPSSQPVLSEKAPSVGDKRWVNLEQWYSLSVGNRVWFLFQPPHSSKACWELYPHEMDSSAVVECEVLEFADFLPIAPSEEIPLNEAHSQYCLVRTFRGGLTFTPEKWRDYPNLFEMKGWLNVRVIRVVPLAQIPLHFPESKEVVALSKHEIGDRYESQQLILEVEKGEETYEWQVRTAGEESRVVLYAFDIMRDAAHICNCLFER